MLDLFGASGTLKSVYGLSDITLLSVLSCIGIIIKNDVKIGGLMFADDFVGLTTNAEDLQKLINVVQGFCNKWRLKSNIKKSAVVVFSKVAITDMCTWKWGDNVIPRVVSYCYLGIEFAENGSWDSHVQKVIDNGKKKLNRLHRFVSNRISVPLQGDYC